MAYLIPPPRKFMLPLSKGGDLVVDFRNNPSNDKVTFVDYDEGVTVQLIIDTQPPIIVDAVISTSHANVKVESSVADDIPTDTVWRAIATIPTSPPTNIVGAFGKVRRFDA